APAVINRASNLCHSLSPRLPAAVHPLTLVHCRLHLVRNSSLGLPQLRPASHFNRPVITAANRRHSPFAPRHSTLRCPLSRPRPLRVPLIICLLSSGEFS